MAVSCIEYRVLVINLRDAVYSDLPASSVLLLAGFRIAKATLCRIGALSTGEALALAQQTTLTHAVNADDTSKRL